MIFTLCRFYIYLYRPVSPSILSILGNTAVLVTATWRHSVLKAPELLTVNLAVTDIGMALSMYPLSVASAFNHTWIGGDPSCLYYGLMGMTFSVASIMTLAAMGLVRYLVTGNPPKSGSKFQRKTISILIGVIWLYSLLWAVFPLLGWGRYGPEPFGLACSVDWAGYQHSLNGSSFIMALAILCTLIPCAVILFSYSGIAWKLHKAYQSIQSNDNLPNSGAVERKVTLMGILISAGFIVSWAPYIFISLWTMFHSDGKDSVAPIVSLLPCLFAK
ncbi:opsin 8, group member a [Sinocyclocheilus grahami]|uniref:opsin 8, group member a n=1 Tax=Sinocyclocheilus grahami TaxID=75366 RepID=UPI0007ACF411|nr:PREDICTED: opsin-5-like [Sinocyclocheilus grahami]